MNFVGAFFMLYKQCPIFLCYYFMAAECYIIYSPKLNRFYVGVTNDGVAERLLRHNNHQYGGHRYTAKTNDWEIYIFLKAVDYSHAIRMERKIKSMKSKVYI